MSGTCRHCSAPVMHPKATICRGRYDQGRCDGPECSPSLDDFAGIPWCIVQPAGPVPYFHHYGPLYASAIVGAAVHFGAATACQEPAAGA